MKIIRCLGCKKILLKVKKIELGQSFPAFCAPCSELNERAWAKQAKKRRKQLDKMLAQEGY